jgi:hypothetical protein
VRHSAHFAKYYKGPNMKDMNILLVDYLTNRIIFFIERFGHQNLDITENSGDAVRYMIDNIYDYIFLGGELGKYGGNCCDVAEFLADHGENPNNGSNIIIHSWDIASVDRLIQLLPSAKYFPFNEVSFSTRFNI